MKKNKRNIVVLLILYISSMPALAQENVNDNSDGSDLSDLYFGQKPPGKKAGIFAPEVLTFETHDSPIISPNGKYLFFVSRRNFPNFVIYWADAGFIEDLKPKELK